MMLLKSKSFRPVSKETTNQATYYKFQGLNDGEVVLCDCVKFVDSDTDICVVFTALGAYFTRHTCKIKQPNELEAMRSLINQTFGVPIHAYSNAESLGMTI